MKYQVKKNLAGAYSVKFDCPGCQVTLSDGLKNAGKPDTCPECNTQFEIPGKKELAEYQTKLQQQEQEKAASLAEKKAEKEKARLEKERKQAEAKEAAEQEKATLEKERQQKASARKSGVDADPRVWGIHRPEPQAKQGVRHSGAALGLLSFCAFCVAGLNFLSAASTETVMQQIVVTLRFYGAAICGCILMVGSCLCFVIAKK